MDLITDETSGLSNAGWTGCEEIVSDYQIPVVNVGPVVKRGFFMPGAGAGVSCAGSGIHRLQNRPRNIIHQ